MSTRSMRRGPASASPLLLFVLGCQDVALPDPADIIWEGEHVAYAEEPGVAEICAGSVPWTDRFVGAVADDLDVKLDAPVRVYRITTATALEICPAGATRCARGGRVYTTATIERHEPVHALRQLEYDFEGHSFFEEGLAELYEDIGVGSTGPNPDDLEAGILVSSGFLPPESYPTAQHFVSFLSNLYGITATEELVSAVAGASSIDEVDGAFQEVLAAPLDDVIAEYRAVYPVCTLYARARHPLECDDVEPVVIPPTGAGARVERPSMTCDDDDVLGTAGQKMWTYATFEIVEGGTYWIEAEDMAGSDGFSFAIIPCDGGCFATLDYWASAAETNTLEFQPGRHLVRFTRAADDPGGVSLHVFPVCPDGPNTECW